MRAVTSLTMRMFLLAVLLALPALTLHAQDTAGAWKPTHTARFGGWDSTCDALGDTQRCYLRFVDVYAGRPQFGVLFAFIEATARGETAAFGIEFDTPLTADALIVRKADAVIWQNTSCTDGIDCRFEGADAAALVAALAEGDTFEARFLDSYNRPQDRQWDLADFATALNDLRAAARIRGLGP